MEDLKTKTQGDIPANDTILFIGKALASIAIRQSGFMVVEIYAKRNF